eukprot:6191360-Pleurochrysis_carterae.AAC.1
MVWVGDARTGAAVGALSSWLVDEGEFVGSHASHLSSLEGIDALTNDCHLDCDEAFVRATMCVQVLDSTVVDTLLSEITSSNASPTLHALVFILGPSPLHAPRDENGIRAWRACISALEDS